MQTVKIWNDAPSEKQLDEIISIIDEGGIIIYPTDTVYALACDALNVKAIDSLCRVKGIDSGKSNLSIVCKDIAQAAEYSKIDNSAFKILKNHTPGPFTFLFKTLSTLPKAFKGRKIVGVRIPDSNTARSIVSRLERPLLTTSIDAADEDYLRNPELMAEAYDGRVQLLVDSGEGGTEYSTIVDMTDSDYAIVREGKGILEL